MTKDFPQFERCIRYATLTDVGMRRKNNQDAHNSLVSSDEKYWQSRGHLFLVADGMGAHAAGELASKLAADSIPHSYSKDLETEPAAALKQAIIDANTNIYQRGQADSEFSGMGTTCSSLLLIPEGAVAAHVGDSRIYRLRNGQLDQLTFDHSLVWEMQAAGRVSAEAAEMHLPKNIITRSLGPSPTVQIDLEGPFPVFMGDVYLLCSDGLTGRVSDEEIGTIIGCLPPDEAARILVDLANLRGGPDNITVIVAQVDHPPVAQNGIAPTELNSTKSLSFIWIATFLCLIAAALFFAFGLIIPGIFLLIGAIVACIVGILQKFDRPEEIDETIRIEKLYGRGPYRSYDCRPSLKMAESLAYTASELRKTAEEMETETNWQTYDAIIERAQDATGKDDFATAIYQYCRGISFVVTTLKNQNAIHRTSDSHVDLI